MGNRARFRQRGFTLLEVVVSLVIGAIVMVFVAMFLVAPVDAYQAHGARAEMVANASTVWPRMQLDLRHALPNSARARRNGSFVVLEMLYAEGYARYVDPPNNATFLVAGTANGIFGQYGPGATLNGVHLSVNNTGEEAYAQAGSMTAPLSNLQLVANGVPGEAQVQLTGAPPLSPTSPRNRIYLVTRPVTYLCDEGQGTITRYDSYAIAAVQAARDTPGELAGGNAEVVARGITGCLFDTQLMTNLPQMVRVTLTSTQGAESVRLQYAAAVENLP